MKYILFILLLLIGCQKEQEPPYIYIDNWKCYSVDSNSYVTYKIHTNTFYKVAVKYKIDILSDRDTLHSNIYIGDKWNVTKDTTITRVYYFKTGIIIGLRQCSFDIL